MIRFRIFTYYIYIFFTPAGSGVVACACVRNEQQTAGCTSFWSPDTVELFQGNECVGRLRLRRRRRLRCLRRQRCRGRLGQLLCEYYSGVGKKLVEVVVKFLLLEIAVCHSVVGTHFNRAFRYLLTILLKLII